MQHLELSDTAGGNLNRQQQISKNYHLNLKVHIMTKEFHYLEYTQQKCVYMPRKRMFKNVHGSTVYNNKNPDSSSTFVKSRMDTLFSVYSHNEILHSDEKEWTTTWMDLTNHVALMKPDAKTITFYDSIDVKFRQAKLICGNRSHNSLGIGW